MEPVSAIALASAGQSSSNVLGSILNYRSQKLNRELQKELAMYGYSEERRNLKYMNQYNSPAAQMQRFQEAGLNKNLMYGQGTSGEQKVLPKYNAPNTQAPQLGSMDIMGPIAQAANVKVQNAQAGLIQNQADNVAADTTLKLEKVTTEGIIQSLQQENVISQQLANQITRATLDDVISQAELKTIQDKLGNDFQRLVNSGQVTENEVKSATLKIKQLDAKMREEMGVGFDKGWMDRVILGTTTQLPKAISRVKKDMQAKGGITKGTARGNKNIQQKIDNWREKRRNK